MNAAQLYEDELYAYVDEPPKGRLPLGAAKVRLRSTESRKNSWETNRKTYAHVTIVEPGDKDPGYSFGSKHVNVEIGMNLTIPARHLVDFWSDYESEANLLRSERKERADRQRRRSLHVQSLINMINWHLQNDKGIHLNVAILDLYEDGSGFVKFSLADMIAWLEIDEQAIDKKIEEMMEE